MRAPTVLALFAAALCLGVPAQADTASDAPIRGASVPPPDIRHAPLDTTRVQGSSGIAAADTTQASQPSHEPVATADTTPAAPSSHEPAAAANADTAAQHPHPTGPPQGFHGHQMPPVAVAHPDTAVSAPVPDAAEADTEIDEEKALEIKLKSDPEAARRYRSPRKAFFLSLLVPGAGQIYCGSWVKATFFVATEISLGVAWYEVAIVQAREKERQAERYAALHWKQERYDSTWARLYQTGTLSSTTVQSTAPNRESFCDAIYGSSKGTGWNGCMEAINGDSTANYSDYSKQFSKGGTTSGAGSWSQDSVLSFRSHNIKDLTAFYNVIGSQDLATGWEDNADVMTIADISAYYEAIENHSTDPSITVTSPWGVSAMQNTYLAMRSRADQLARMQKWFMGGMILNHLAAAFDAALQAGRMNRELLQLRTSWLDGVGVRGGLAWSTGLPAMQARVDWSF